MPSVAKANGTPALARAAAVADLFLPLRLAVGQDSQRLVALGGRLLAIFGSVGTLGSSGKLSRSTTGTLADLEAVGDLGGLAAADDHRGRAELLGEVERAVDLVAGVAFPPDGEFLASARPEVPSSAGSNGG